MPHETVRIILHGTERLSMPTAGHFSRFSLRPGVHEIGAEHWEALKSAQGPDAAELQAALAQGWIGIAGETRPPVLVTKQILVPANSEEGRAALAAKAEAEEPDETRVTIDVPDDEPEKPKKKARTKKAPREG